MDTFNENHFNLDVDLISLVLIPYLEVSIRFKIKECITTVYQEYGCTITKRKAYLGRKRAFEIIYGDWDKSFSSLPRYIATLKYFNPGTVVEWRHERSPRRSEYIFNYVFWSFKTAIDGFVHCRPRRDVNAFLKHLKQHDVKQRSGICLISDRHGGILSSVRYLLEWHEPYAYHRYCVRHLKVNFQKKYHDKALHDLMWMAATEHQQCKFTRLMEVIRQLDPRAYTWLMGYELHKWTLHADSGR
ncbi:uncharacterized protein [Nicotiana sylvestris]|uniref:uncharacterized protein n=1 Tax=Nicotiana sylvestris TaxID=4096 RepID=UPI00388C5212